MKTVLFAFFALTVQSINAQWQLNHERLWVDIDQVEQDNLGNFYVTNYRGDLTKFSADGKLLNEYSSPHFARVNEIDVISQLKLVLFYQDLQEIVLLDRYLTTPVRYRMSDFGMGYVSEVVPNHQQNVWLVDVSNFMLILVDLRQKHVIEKKSLSKLLDQETAEILSLKFDRNLMLLRDKHQGLLVFDNIGNFIQSISTDEIQVHGIYQGQLFGVRGEDLVIKDLFNSELLNIPLPTVDFDKLLYSKDRLVLFDANGFKIYKYLSGDFFKSR